MKEHSEEENSKVETVLSSETIYEGNIVKLVRNQIRLSTGRTTFRDIIEHPGSVGIVPLLDDGSIILINQFRLATGRAIWEIPAGTREKGESPEACAKRELEEEIGFVSSSLEPLFKCYLAPGYTTELMHVFVAKGLVKTQQHTEEDEIITTHQFSPVEALEMVSRGEIKDAKTIGAITYLIAVEK